MPQHQADLADTINMFVMLCVVTYFLFLLLTNQRMTVFTSSTLKLNESEQVTDHSVHIGTAFLVTIILLPRCIDSIKSCCQ